MPEVSAISHNIYIIYTEYMLYLIYIIRIYDKNVYIKHIFDVFKGIVVTKSMTKEKY